MGERGSRFVLSVGVGPSGHLGERELKKASVVKNDVESHLFACFFLMPLVYVMKSQLLDCHLDPDAKSRMGLGLVKAKADRSLRRLMEQQGSRSTTRPAVCLPSQQNG